MMKIIIPGGVLVFLLLGAPDLWACGASAGSSGVAVCNLSEERENVSKNWHVGGGYSFSETKIVFSQGGVDHKLAQSRHVALASLEWRSTPRWNFQFGAGALVAGRFETAGGPLDFNPGFVGMIGSSALVVKNDGAVPFVLGTAQLSGVTSSTKNDVGYHALDLRVGAAVGWTFFRTLSPYAVARAFGGPVFWELTGAKVIGTDLYKYQLGAGVSYMIANRLDLFVEGIGLGERGISAGLGLSL